MKYYKSTRIVTTTGIIDGYLGVEDGKFVEIRKDKPEGEIEDFGNKRIIPGIIDTHNHGAGGYRFDDASEDEVRKALKAEAAFGVTGIFPTIHCKESYAKIANVADTVVDGTKILGINSEGPWGTRVGEKGDPNNTYYEPVSYERADAMIKDSRGWLKLVDLAPEKEGALDMIKYLVGKGLTVSAYHTNATYEECLKGIDAGIRTATHLGNVMTGLHHRDIGTFGACLERDEVWTEQICDGLHVCLPMVRLVMKVKPHNRIMMVSDNGNFLGAPVGKYKGSAENANNDRRIINVTPDGFVLSESGRLSGSSKPVLYGIGNLVEKLCIGLEDACRMSSLNPATHYNLEGRGGIKVGNYADFVVIDDQYNADKTFVEGRTVWDRSKETFEFNPQMLKELKIA